MKKLAKIGGIGFGLLALSELFGIVGESQAFASLIISEQLDEEEIYEFLDDCIESSSGYCKFKIKKVKSFIAPIVTWYSR